MATPQQIDQAKHTGCGICGAVFCPHGICRLCGTCLDCDDAEASPKPCQPEQKIVHLCVSVRGMLNWDRRETTRNLKFIKKNDGTPYASVDEFRNDLMDELARGHEVLPMHGEPCEGFDFKKGCQGHYATPEAERQPACGGGRN